MPSRFTSRSQAPLHKSHLFNRRSNMLIVATGGPQYGQIHAARAPTAHTGAERGGLRPKINRKVLANLARPGERQSVGKKQFPPSCLSELQSYGTTARDGADVLVHPRTAPFSGKEHLHPVAGSNTKPSNVIWPLCFYGADGDEPMPASHVQKSLRLGWRPTGRRIQRRVRVLPLFAAAFLGTTQPIGRARAHSSRPFSVCSAEYQRG